MIYHTYNIQTLNKCSTIAMCDSLEDAIDKVELLREDKEKICIEHLVEVDGEWSSEETYIYQSNRWVEE